MPLFPKNLDTNARVIRGIAGLAMCVGAILIWPQSRVAGINLALSSAFVAFEAARGWCALRVRREDEILTRNLTRDPI
ncbi:MAG: hypothetical protein WBV90_02855 [Terrimicrobiaceae bacterium]